MRADVVRGVTPPLRPPPPSPLPPPTAAPRRRADRDPPAPLPPPRRRRCEPSPPLLPSPSTPRRRPPARPPARAANMAEVRAGRRGGGLPRELVARGPRSGGPSHKLVVGSGTSRSRPRSPGGSSFPPPVPLRGLLPRDGEPRPAGGAGPASAAAAAAGRGWEPGGRVRGGGSGVSRPRWSQPGSADRGTGGVYRQPALFGGMVERSPPGTGPGSWAAGEGERGLCLPWDGVQLGGVGGWKVGWSCCGMGGCNPFGVGGRGERCASRHLPLCPSPKASFLLCFDRSTVAGG